MGSTITAVFETGTLNRHLHDSMSYILHGLLFFTCLTTEWSQLHHHHCTVTMTVPGWNGVERFVLCKR